jgi:AraC-like DNA-binding protein
MLRVASGIGYLQGADGILELSPGDAACLAGESAGIILASQLGQMRIQSFSVSTDFLAGLLTAAERHYLDCEARRGRSAIRYRPASDAVAQEFTRISQIHDPSNALLFRCWLLQIFAGMFGKDLVGQVAAAPEMLLAVERFRQIILDMPEAELRNCSVDDLARKCRCSKRHFSRLFRGYFGVPIRQKQTSLRLEKAKLLLQESDAKVIHVALESGYQHLSLFNAMFKRHFGVTPSEWRRRQTRKTTLPKRGVQMIPFRVGFAAKKSSTPACSKADPRLGSYTDGRAAL